MVAAEEEVALVAWASTVEVEVVLVEAAKVDVVVRVVSAVAHP